MARRSVIRASDAEREHVADRMRRAAADGRLLATEFEHRLGLAFRARTLGELDALVSDLPGARRRRGSRAPARVTPLRVAIYAAAGLVLLSAVAAVMAFVVGALLVVAVWTIVLWWLTRLRPHGRRRGRGAPPLRAARRGLL